MKLIVDRFEGKFAICQNCDTKEMIDLDKAILPENICSGDLIELNVSILPNDEQKQKIQEQINRLWK